MIEMRRWLDALGLGEYANALRRTVDLRALPMLSEEDLKELGLMLGHRRVLPHAVSELSGDPQQPTSEAAHDAATSPSGGAERRQLTVMFCDLGGSTALSRTVDPEDYPEILPAHHDAARAAIAPYEGYIARYMGNGLLVYFGYPQAHEDDAERAVRAGLDIVAAVRELEVGGQAALAVRIGVATGPAVVGDIVGEGASEERAVLGETPNLAARLQEIAAPNTVAISRATRRLALGRFELEYEGLRELKGIAEPVPVYRAVSVRSDATRFEARRTSARCRRSSVETASWPCSSSAGRRRVQERVRWYCSRARPGSGRAD